MPPERPDKCDTRRVAVAFVPLASAASKAVTSLVIIKLR